MDPLLGLYHDTQEFTKLKLSRMVTSESDTKGKVPYNSQLIIRMVEDELAELKEAKDAVEQIDALLDALYYVLQIMGQSEEGHSGFSGPGYVNTWIKYQDCLFPLSESTVNAVVRELIEWMHDPAGLTPRRAYGLAEKLWGLATLNGRNGMAHVFWRMIHGANMRKFGPGGRLDSSGKWLKPVDFVPPDQAMRDIWNQFHICLQCSMDWNSWGKPNKQENPFLVIYFERMRDWIIRHETFREQSLTFNPNLMLIQNLNSNLD